MGRQLYTEELRFGEFALLGSRLDRPSPILFNLIQPLLPYT
jgi:hypothetical protein